MWVLDGVERVRSVSPSPYSEDQKRAVNAACGPKGWVFISSTAGSHGVYTTEA